MFNCIPLFTATNDQTQIDDATRCRHKRLWEGKDGLIGTQHWIAFNPSDPLMMLRPGLTSDKPVQAMPKKLYSKTRK
jgi:hypothetical protein